MTIVVVVGNNDVVIADVNSNIDDKEEEEVER